MIPPIDAVVYGYLTKRGKQKQEMVVLDRQGVFKILTLVDGELEYVPAPITHWAHLESPEVLYEVDEF